MGLLISLDLSLSLGEKSDAVEVDKTFLNSCLNLSPYKEISKLTSLTKLQTDS